MKLLSIYRILTYILLPIIALIGIVDIFIFFLALANPIMLLGVFILACVVIYSISAFIFLRKGIDQTKPCNPNLKDWIRVNAFVTLVFVFQGLIEAVMKILNPALLKQTVTDVYAMQQQMMPSNATEATMLGMMKTAVWVSVALSILILSHVILTFRLLKTNNYIFHKE
jgi:hypothetical protein